MPEKLRNSQVCRNFPKKVFVYWKSQKLQCNKKKNKIFHDSLCVFIIISAPLYLLYYHYINHWLIHFLLLFWMNVVRTWEETFKHNSWLKFLVKKSVCYNGTPAFFQFLFTQATSLWKANKETFKVLCPDVFSHRWIGSLYYGYPNIEPKFFRTSWWKGLSRPSWEVHFKRI